MTITAPTMKSDFAGFLSPAESAPIFNEAVRTSVFQNLFRRIPLGAEGQKIPVVTSRPNANWVGEAGQKPTTKMGMGLLTIEPKKLAAIAVMSAEVVRSNPGNYTGVLRSELAGAFARAFDWAVGYGVGGDGTGTGPFDKNISQTTKSVALGTTAATAGGLHGDFVAAMSLLVGDKKKLTGYALDESTEPMLWGAVDTTGRPLYTELATDDTSQTIARAGRLAGRPSWMGEGVAHAGTVGFAGDFTKGAWGAVGGISYRVSTEATVTINGELTSLWEHNLVAVLAEAEYGFVVDNVQNFVKLTD